MFYEFSNLNDPSPFATIYIRAENSLSAVQKAITFKLVDSSLLDTIHGVSDESTPEEILDHMAKFEQANWFFCGEVSESTVHDVVNTKLLKMFTTAWRLKKMYPDIEPLNGKTFLVVDGFDVYIYNRPQYAVEKYVLNLERHDIYKLLSRIECVGEQE